MESNARQRLAGLPIPGFLTRLSHLIVIQALFVFAAVALLVLFPGQPTQVDTELALQRPLLQAITQRTTSALDRQTSPADSTDNHEKVRSALFRFFLEEKSIEQADIYVSTGRQSLAPLFSFRRPTEDQAEHGSDHELLRLVDSELISLGLQQPQAPPITSMCGARHLVHYFPFRAGGDLPAVLVAITEHDLVISHRSRLKYTLFVLFLCSVLVSFLTVHLISNRFKGPLDHLATGFQKTAEGELYYIFETNGDAELRKLTTAFNRMSETLWQNQKKLKQSNYHLSNANRALLESQLFLATLIDSSPSCIVAADSGGRIMIFNNRASQVFGYGKEEAVGTPADKLFTSAAGESRIYQPSQTAQSGVEALCRRRDGSTFPAYLIASPIITPDGTITAYLYILRDISESKNFQRMMIRLDRYYTRGEMAGEVAHEINNYLAVLSGNIELLPLAWSKGDQDKFHHRITVMKQTVDKIARFSDGLADTDPDTSTPEPADMNQLVENTVAFLKPQNKFDGIDIITALSPDLSVVEVDVGQIQQLLVNLLHNAAEALREQPNRTMIWITTSVSDQGPDKWVRVEVKDNGPGVPEEQQELLFAKRFTTKRKGNGIGLITCRKIVQAHGGKIAYRTDNGAVFSFDIPTKRQKTDDEAAAEAGAQQSFQPA